MGKLTRHQERRRDAFAGSLQDIDKSRQGLSAEVFVTLLTRSAIPSTPDGYPSSSGFDGSPPSHGGQSSVESALLAREKPRRDPLVDVTRFIEYATKEASFLLAAARGALAYTFQVEDEMRERQTSAPCLICAVNPAVSAGYCTDCWREWYEHGRPDRLRWQAYKTELKNSEGILLVVECPPPVTGAKARRGPFAEGQDE